MLLRQPYIYGQRLSALNESFPSSLQKESRQEISLPVADRQSVITGGPANGKFLQSNPVGALQVSSNLLYAGWRPLSMTISRFDEGIKERDMIILMDIRTIRITSISAPDKLAWCSPTGVVFQEFTAVGVYNIFLRGQYIYVKKTGITGNMITSFSGYPR